ncbi:MAG: DUF4968 domain-containing protein [Bacteroidales bacterium]|nr:DUF4968 domain-containing protein [Bacteroidales bacterium]
MKRIIFSMIIFSMITNSYSQQNMNKSLGNLISFSRDEQTINIVTDFGKAGISVFSPNILRIRVVLKEFNEDFSYSVIAKPEKCVAKVNEFEEYIEICTDSLILKITKNPVRFQFLTLERELINEDDPAFGTSWIGTEVTTYKKLQPKEKFIGLGEKTGNLDRRGSAYTNWNTDNPRHGAYDDPLYASIPFYIGIHNKFNYGIFLDNSYKTHFNFGASNNRFSYFSAEDGEMDYYFIYHNNIADILKSYSFLTGFMQMPPIWSLGYQQCRWSYYPDSEVLNVAKTFREKKIPADVIYLDIHYMDAYKIFTWHPERFPTPEKMLNELKEMGFHTTVIVDPGIKIENNYDAYNEGIEKDLFIKYPDNTIYTAQVWPGWCHFPDFTNPTTRKWWGNKFRDYVDLGIDGFWNDMNEIASWGGTTPYLVEFDWEGKNATYLQAKNVYGLEMARSTFEGTKKLLNGKRPLILTRAGFAGLQRFTAIWTGDNTASNEHMMLGVRLVNSLGLSGIPFCGYDVGGFMGDPSAQLFTRWLTIGAFSPFFRGHTHYNSKDAEPWAFGEETEEIARNYIQFRYNLMPYIYSVFYEAHKSGLPVARSLAIDNTFDEKVFWYKYQNQYLFGPSFLIIPVESDKEITKVYLPINNWYDISTGNLQAGNSEIYVDCPQNELPVFIKESSIIPVQSPVQNLGEKPSDTLQVFIFNGKTDNSFVYYEDDGCTYEFEKGDFYKRKISFSPEEKQITFGQKEGFFDSKFKFLKIILIKFENSKKRMLVNNSFVNCKIENSYPGNQIYKQTRNIAVKYFIIENIENKIQIKF